MLSMQFTLKHRSATCSHGAVRAGVVRAVDVRASAAAAGLALLLGAGAPAVAAQPDDLSGLSLDQLMNEPVTSVSKKTTKLSESAAAIYVVTQEDIRRLGITSIPDALRTVPGLDVARISATQWAVSARGFNGQLSNKLLVLVDGRTVYSPVFGGVYWSLQDVMLEDVERVEVIRGPGAALWGANAVDGVINVITKTAGDSRGVLLAASGGSEDQPSFTGRYGGSLDKDIDFRVYATYANHDSFVDTTGTNDPNNWHTFRSGGRLDWHINGADSLTLQGDTGVDAITQSADVSSLTPPSVTPTYVNQENKQTNVLGRWTHTFAANSSLTVQTYVDHGFEVDGYGGADRQTYDLEVEHRIAFNSRNDLVWGAGYRNTKVDEQQTFSFFWSPEDKDIGLTNLFAQDELTVIPNRLRITLGSKFENSNLVGWTEQPDLRVLWTPSARQSFWASASRAAGTPPLFERYVHILVGAAPGTNGAPPAIVTLDGNPSLDSEILLSYQAGYRFAPASGPSLDITTYTNHYSGLIDLVPNGALVQPLPAPLHLDLSEMYQNAHPADTYGLEASTEWQIFSRWKVAGSYTWLHMKVPTDPLSAAGSPEQQAQIRSYLDLPHHWEINTAFYYVESVDAVVGAISAADPGFIRVPSYVRADFGLVWTSNHLGVHGDTLSLGIWGQNLLESRHLEYAATDAPWLTGIPRSVFAKLTWRH